MSTGEFKNISVLSDLNHTDGDAITNLRKI